MFKKYELTSETKVAYGKTLYRIRALLAFGEVKAGELGGWVEKESNLSQSGDAWVYDDAQVYGNAQIYGDAQVYKYASVYGNAQVYGSAQVYGDARVFDQARVFGAARVYNNAQVYGDARVFDQARVFGAARVYNNAKVYGDAEVCDHASVYGNAQVYGDAEVCDGALVYYYASVYGNARLCGNAEIELNTHLLQIGAIGSRNGFTTFFRTKEKRLFVSCGCFCGPVNEFEDKVRQTHGNNKHAKAYALAIELAKLQVEDVEVQ